MGRCLIKRVRGLAGTWARGYVGSWVRGLAGTWARWTAPPNPRALVPTRPRSHAPSFPRALLFHLPLDLPDHPEQNLDFARIEIGAACHRTDIVVDPIGIVRMEEPHLQQQLLGASVQPLDEARGGELARGR